MRKFSCLVGFFVFVALGAGLVGCQREAAVQSGQAKELLETWMNQGNKLIEMAMEFPADKYDYRPTEEVRSFGEIVRHIAASNFRYIRGEQGRPYDADEFKPENFTGKDDYVRLLQRCYQEGAEVLQPENDHEMLEPVKNPYGDYSTSRYAYWMQAVENAAEHYGNLVVYYRLNGIVPPASRPQSQ